MSYNWNWRIFWSPSPEGAGTYWDMLLQGLLTTLEVSALAWIVALVLGCLMDAMAMIILTVPIVFPAVMALGFDPVWFGVIIVMTVELGLIHPPVGLNIFVINRIAPDIGLGPIIWGTLPFVALMAVAVVILSFVPGIAMWLPDLVYAK